MEVGEMVAVAKKAPFKKGDCPFCGPQEKVSSANEITAAYDEDTDADNNLDNDSGTLATNLKDRPQSPKRAIPEFEKGEKAPILDMPMASAAGRTWHQWAYPSGLIPVLYGAHHCIPGNDGLKASTLYKDGWLGPADDGTDTKNVGYNINSARNGVWLAGNYAVRPWKGIDPEFQKAYAFLAMADTSRQFHDAHKVYSSRVELALNDIAKLMKKMKDDKCPACKAGSDEDDPPYHLNARLNAVSGWLRGKVATTSRSWKAKIVTSSWCNKFKKSMRKKGGRQRLEDLRRNPIL